MSQTDQERQGLVLEDFQVRLEGKEVVRGVTLTVGPGEVHALMGPNGTGKSTLALALMGHPRYGEVRGAARLRGIDLLPLSADARARAGLFLAMQAPAEIPGVPFADFLRTARKALGREGLAGIRFRKALEAELDSLGLDRAFARRYLNEGFSGGEKKRSEIVQLRLLRPAVAVLDEIDSGLDIDALRSVARSVAELAAEGTGILIITHYRRILDHLPPDRVHVMAGGRIVRSAPGMELANLLEEGGYEAVVGRPVAVS